MALESGTRIWLSDQPVSYDPGSVQNAYISPFPSGGWQTVESRVDLFKIYSGTIYRLANHGYSYDESYSQRYYPTAALELVEMLSDLSRLNDEPSIPSDSANRTTVYMESPVLQPGILPNGAHYNSSLEGFDGSFLGVIGYIRNSLQYAVTKGNISLEEAKAIGIKYIAMNQPLFIASTYKTPDNLWIDGVRIQSPQWTIEEVAMRAATALFTAKQILGPYDPGLRFADIEPLPYVTATQVDTWVKAFNNAAISLGLRGDDAKLAFFQADVVWGRPGWQTNLQEISTILQQNNIPLNIIINGYNNETDPVAWTDHALNSLVAIHNLPSLNYDSLSVQNWNIKSPTPLFDQRGTTASPGTLTNVARYIPSLETVAQLYATHSPNVGPSPIELFFSTRNLATEKVTTDDLTNSLLEIASFRGIVYQYTSANQPSPNVAVLISGGEHDGTPASPTLNAIRYLPSGFGIMRSSATVLPRVDTGEYYLKNITRPDLLGSLYLMAAPNISIYLPNGVSTVINFLNDMDPRSPATIYGGSAKSFVYLANGASTYILGSALETVIDASGTGNSVIQGSSWLASATIRGANNTIATLRITNVGTVALSSVTEYARIEIILGSALLLNNAKNVEIVVVASRADRLQSFQEMAPLQILSNVHLTGHITNSSQFLRNETTTELQVTANTSGATSRFDGGRFGIVATLANPGTISQHADSRNLTYSIAARITLVLNGDRQTKVQILALGAGSSVTIGNAGQSVVAAKGVAVQVQAGTNYLDETTRLNGGGNGTLSIVGAGQASLGQNAIGFSAIQLMGTAGKPGPEVALSRFQPGAVVYNLHAEATVRVTENTQSVQNVGNGTVTVHMAIKSAAARIDSKGGKAVIQYSDGGRFSTNIEGTAKLFINFPSLVYLNSNSNISVLIPATNTGLNTVGVKAAGQSVFVENGRYSVIYIDAKNLGVSTGTVLSGGGQAQLNIYNNGSVTLSAETQGLAEIYLYANSLHDAFHLRMSDFQRNVRVIDTVGGSVVEISDKRQIVLNVGYGRTIVRSLAVDAGLEVDGGNFGATLDIVDGGEVVLSNKLRNVLIKLNQPSDVQSGFGNNVVLDAAVGSSRIEVGRAGHVVRTGFGNKIVDKSAGSIMVEGTLQDWSNNTLVSFGLEDLLHITDLQTNTALFETEQFYMGTIVRIRSGETMVELKIDGMYGLSEISASPDGNGGSYITYGRYLTAQSVDAVMVAGTGALSIARTEAWKVEGGSGGTTPFTFTITRTGDLGGTAAADWSVAGGGAVGGTVPAGAADFTNRILPSGRVAFSVGQATQVITIPVASDDQIELNEAFTVTLSGLQAGVELGTASATGVILNDDFPPSGVMSIVRLQASRGEGQSGSTPFTFLVNRTGSTTGPASATWTVSGGGVGGTVATNGSDFVDGKLPTGRVSYAPGETTKLVSMDVKGDSTVELNESFTVTLSNVPPGVTLGTASATAIVWNDDTPGTGTLSIARISAFKPEGGPSGTTPFTFRVTRTGDLSGTAAADWMVTGGGAAGTLAANGADFVGGQLPAGRINFASGQAGQTITLHVAADMLSELNESFTITLSNPAAAVEIGPASATGIILNDDFVSNATNQSLTGTSNPDVFLLGGGLDTVVGKGGMDFFLFQPTALGAAASNVTTIEDFSPLLGEKLNLSVIDAIAGTAANDAFTFIGTAPFSGNPGELRWEGQGSMRLIEGNVDADTTANLTIYVKAAGPVDSNWFVL